MRALSHGFSCTLLSVVSMKSWLHLAVKRGFCELLCKAGDRKFCPLVDTVLPDEPMHNGYWVFLTRYVSCLLVSRMSWVTCWKLSIRTISTYLIKKAGLTKKQREQAPWRWSSVLVAPNLNVHFICCFSTVLRDAKWKNGQRLYRLRIISWQYCGADP